MSYLCFNVNTTCYYTNVIQKSSDIIITCLTICASVSSNTRTVNCVYMVRASSSVKTRTGLTVVDNSYC